MTDIFGYELDPMLGVVEWAHENWLTLVLSGEIIGAVFAIKVGAYKRGVGWLVAALATVWLGAY